MKQTTDKVTKRNNMQKSKTKSQKVNKEAFYMLAKEIGLPEACRKLGVPIPTAKSWKKRYGWKLHRLKTGRPERSLPASNASSLHPIADALDASHKELENATKTALAQAIAKAAQGVALKGALDVASITELKDAIHAADKLYGWNKPQTEVNVGVAVGLVCTEEQRKRMIAMREKLQAPLPALPAPIPLREPETKPQTNAGEVNGNSATNDAAPGGSPLWSVPAGAKATSDDSPVFRHWLEHEAAEPEVQGGVAGK
jgi:hypothetical protein